MVLSGTRHVPKTVISSLSCMSKRHTSAKTCPSSPIRDVPLMRYANKNTFIGNIFRRMVPSLSPSNALLMS